MLIEHEGQRPQIAASAYIAPTAVISGDVRIGEGSRVMFGAVVSADGGSVDIGSAASSWRNAVIRGRARFPA